MSSDEEHHKNTMKLTKSEQCTAWRTKTKFLCMSGGDQGKQIFSDMGQDPQGYQSFANNAGGDNKRKKWNALAQKLIGKVGGLIEHPGLLEVWSEEEARIEQEEELRPYVFAHCMEKLNHVAVVFLSREI